MFAKLTLDNIQLTPEGGVAVRYKNATGAAAIKGTVVSPSFSDDTAVSVAIADSIIPIGVMYAAHPNAGDCWVVVSGVAEVLLKDGTPSVRGNWVGTADVVGRAVAGGGGHPGTTPPDQAVHNQEIGHCAESKDAGTNVLAKVTLHFN